MAYTIDSGLSQVSVANLLEMDTQIPWFQREFVWEESRKHEFLISLLENIPCDVMTVRSHKRDGSKGSSVYHLIDGSQRYRTLKSFIKDNALELPVAVLREVGIHIPSTFTERKIKFSDLPEELKAKINGKNIPVYEIKHDSDEMDYRLFVKLNKAKKLSNWEQQRGGMESITRAVEGKYGKKFETLFDHCDKGNRGAYAAGIVFLMIYLQTNKPKLTGKKRSKGQVGEMSLYNTKAVWTRWLDKNGIIKKELSDTLDKVNLDKRLDELIRLKDQLDFDNWNKQSRHTLLFWTCVWADYCMQNNQTFEDVCSKIVDKPPSKGRSLRDKLKGGIEAVVGSGKQTRGGEGQANASLAIFQAIYKAQEEMKTAA